VSFDIFLQKFVNGQPADANPEPVRRVLMTRQHSGPDTYGFYRVRFADDDEVEFSAKGLDGAASFGGCAFHVRRLSPHLFAFLWDIAKAGELVLLPAMKDSIAILSSPDQKQHLPAELINHSWTIVVCESAEELQALLTGGFNSWRKYLDQAIKHERKGQP
jgi:hypothetical protein